MDTIEEPSASSPSGTSTVRTPAYASFDSNTDKLLHVFHAVLRGWRAFNDDFETSLAPEMTGIATEIRDRLRIKASNQEPKESIEIINNRIQTLSDTLKPIEQFMNGFRIIVQWTPVLLVTTVEAYLEDVLMYAAKVDPAIMESSRARLTVPYAEVAQAQSLEELKDGLKEILSPRWAKNFLNDGGPANWIEKLTKMGVRGYRPETAMEMETLWGVRHLIVHSGGVATPEFVRRHPEIDAKVGEGILIPRTQIFAWIDVVFDFADVTDSYFVKRCGPGMPPTTDTKI